MYILNELAGNSFMVFCSTCANTQRVALMLRNLGLTAIPLHGQMSQVMDRDLPVHKESTTIHTTFDFYALTGIGIIYLYKKIKCFLNYFTVQKTWSTE